MTTHRRHAIRRFLHDHSLTLVSLLVLGLWIILYRRADPETHVGAFYGNAIADWSGTVLIVMATKWLFERGSTESKKAPRHFKNRLREFLVEHSLTLFIIASGIGWIALYSALNPMDKWGQVVGNIVSEWSQVLGMVLFTKVLVERGSKESRD
ncbi:MAG TPA: hypothetical protein VFD86_03915 [Nitrospira sp.]|jgi:hypothetical protein|nr:hypothetical protein [Nitrospira sp.]